ncbi:hypothetical protein [Marinovum sp. B10]|uniref:hypothetical protein n=1 Tax=Marinovum sp. B10 TaxID=3449224 RepID=UPI003EDCA823
MADKSEKRKELEARAEKAGLDYPHNIGDAKLEERVLAAEAAQGGGGRMPGVRRRRHPPSPRANLSSRSPVRSRAVAAPGIASGPSRSCSTRAS